MPSDQPEPLKIAEIHLDESSQNNHKFLILGAVAVEQFNCQKLEKLIAAARLPSLPDGELKWTKVSKTKLAAYKRVVDVIFDNQEWVHFHSLFVDTTKFDHSKYNDGSKEIGFNKEIYQLAIKISRIYNGMLFHLYPDYRETTQLPEDLRLILNRGCRKDGDTRDWPFRRCQFRDSKNTPPLQLTDILIGALAYELNGHAKAENASPAKSDLAAYVLKRAGIVDLTKGTARVGRFTVWPRQLRKGVPQS